MEETRVPFHTVLRDRDFGVHNLVVSHKPTGEAGQGNYTTILRWTGITDEVFELNLTDRTLELYEPDSPDGPYLLIVD